MILEVLLIGIITFLTFLEMNRQYKSFRLKHISGPTEIPFIGSKYSFRFNKIRDIETFSTDVCTEKTVKFFMFHHPVIITYDSELIKIILTNELCTNRPYVFEFFGLDNGLVASNHHVWHPLRRKLDATFSQQVINGLIPSFDTRFKMLSDELLKFVDLKPFDFYEVISKTIFDSICEVTLETTVDGFGYRDLNEIEDFVYKRVMNTSLHPNFVYKMTSMYKRETRTRNKIRSVLQTLVTDKRKEIQAQRNMSSKSFLQRLLTMQINGKYLNDIEVFENLATMLVAGSESNTTGLSFVVLALAMHPDIQEKCFQEINEVFSQNLSFTPETINRLSYLDMVIKETFRLFPPNTLLFKENREDLQYNGHSIPKGTILLVNLLSLHRDSDSWGETPLNFNPDRFTPENVKNRQSFAYLPFGAGFRNCIGKRQVMTSLKIALVHLITRYQFTTPLKMSELKLIYTKTLNLSNGFMVQLTKRPAFE